MFGNDFALVNKEKALNHFKKACTSVNTCLDYLDFVQKEFDLFNFPKSERAQTFSLAKQLCEKDFKEGGPKKFSDDVNKELKDIIEIGLEDSVYKAINYGSLAQNLYREKYLGAFDVANACYIAGVFETQDDDFKAGQEYFLRSCYYGKIEACKIAEQNLKGEKNIEKLKTLYYSICIEDDKKRSDRFRSNVCLDGATFYSRLKNFKTANEMLNRSCELGNFKSCYLLAIGNSKYQAFGKSQLAHSNKLNEKDAIFYYAQFLLAKGQKIPNESFEKIVDYCQSGIVDFCELQQAIGGSGEKQ